MDLAFCYENVVPSRGGCETYIADLARRLVGDGHTVHLYACRWDAAALPASLRYHALAVPRGPRFLRPWRFAAACQRAMELATHDVTIGFDKTWGQDVLYPQGGLHAASAEHNFRKHRQPMVRGLSRLIKSVDLAHWSFSLLERRQYMIAPKPLIVVNSEMVREHFCHYHGMAPGELRVVRSAIDANRFPESDRPRRRVEWRQHWGLPLDATVGVFVAMNYHLKGLEPLLHAVKQMPEDARFALLIAGGPHSAAYERLAQRLNIEKRVRFIGYCGEPRNLYFAGDFLVHPTFYDPCSLVVLEALACGLPVVTSRFNGASELMTPPHEGYVVHDPHDHAALAWCMTQLLDPARRGACSHAARKAAGQWTFDHHYRALFAVFQESSRAQARRLIRSFFNSAPSLDLIA